MGVELQIRADSLAALTARSLQRGLRTACAPSIPGLSIDRLDVVANETTLLAVPGGVELRVPVEVFVVTDANLLAAPNGVPNGTAQPAGRIVFAARPRLLLAQPNPANGAFTRVTLDLAVQEPNLGPIGGLLGNRARAVAQELLNALPASSLDLTNLFWGLGFRTFQAADTVLVNGVVAMRLDPSGAPGNRLAAGQAWGVFISGDALARSIRDRIAPQVAAKLPGVNIDAVFEPQGSLPRVRVTTGAGTSVLGQEFRFEGKLLCDFQLLSGASPLLRLNCAWSVHAFLGPLPGFLEAIAEQAIADVVSDAFDPVRIGGTATGPQSFVIDQPLQPIGFPDVTFRYDTLVPSNAGVVLGGRVQVRQPAERAFEIRVSRFGMPRRLQVCSKLAKSGSGAPSREPPTIHNTEVIAQVEIEGAGRICAVEIRTPGKTFEGYVDAPPPGTVAEDAEIRVTLPYAVGGAMTQPMTLVIRTPRGVRLVDLGQPPKPKVDANGRLLDVRDDYLPDCLMTVPRGRGRWGIGWHFEKDDFIPPPKEDPGWATFLRESGGLIVQLVRLQGLDAGEFVRFRSASHSIEAVADGEGRLALPVFLPLAARSSPALLERANGRPLARHVSVDTAVFTPHVKLTGELADAPKPTQTGGIEVATRAARGATRHVVGSLGIQSERLTELNPQPLPPGGDLGALNPQPLPPGGDGDLGAFNPQPLPPGDDGELNLAERMPVSRGALPLSWAEGTGLRGLKHLGVLPGFADQPIAVAELDDGQRLLIDRAGGSARVAGTIAGPVGAFDIVGGFAVTGIPGGVAVLRFQDPAGDAVPVERPQVEALLASPEIGRIREPGSRSGKKNVQAESHSEA
jgi:hypothetical protein